MAPLARARPRPTASSAGVPTTEATRWGLGETLAYLPLFWVATTGRGGLRGGCGPLRWATAVSLPSRQDSAIRPSCELLPRCCAAILGICGSWTDPRVDRYLAYYIPCLNWIQQYKLSYLQGDFIAAVTMASFYLPMALSLASNLAHVPPIFGLYGFIFNPFIYAMLGSSPQMVIGPEAAGSLLVGTVVKASVDSGGEGSEDNDVLQAQICGVVAGMAGAMVLIAGLARLGFLDSVLSRPFLRGFISAIGFVIAVDQLIPELGLAALAEEVGVNHGSSVDKIRFIVSNAGKAHKLTFAVAGVSFVVIMIFR